MTVLIGEGTRVVEGDALVSGEVDDWAQDVSSKRKSRIRVYTAPMRCVIMVFPFIQSRKILLTFSLAECLGP